MSVEPFACHPPFQRAPPLSLTELRSVAQLRVLQRVEGRLAPAWNVLARSHYVLHRAPGPVQLQVAVAFVLEAEPAPVAIVRVLPPELVAEAVLAGLRPLGRGGPPVGQRGRGQGDGQIADDTLVHHPRHLVDRLVGRRVRCCAALLLQPHSAAPWVGQAHDHLSKIDRHVSREYDRQHGPREIPATIAGPALLLRCDTKWRIIIQVPVISYQWSSLGD
mmetsp:Transcript_51062/g.143738  ORF Transcript_51062/g.143738 Transcript_51062/m.143738 type:complete len:219 (+) Transcript_51062:1049-1705(+)